MDAFTILLAPFWGLGILAQFLGAALVFKRAIPSRKKRLSSAQVSPPISILKPLKGVEPGLREDLRSFFTLEYREFELLFCLETPMDPAFAVVREMASEFPGVNYRFFFSGCAGKDRNPKVANMEGGYRSANYDWILITDSNVRMSEALVADFTDEIGDPSLGIVSAVVRGDDSFSDAPSTFAGTIEAVYLNTFYARGMALAEAAGKECVVGKLMLFRKSAMERMGGIRTLGIYLAEDYMAGIGLKRLGYRIKIARVPVTQVIGQYRFEDFWRRHVRWGKIRKAQAPVAFLLDPGGFRFGD
jgi:ceramide glucosyltransferase